MENTTNNSTNPLADLVQSINDEIYTTLLDHNVDPSLAYEQAFNSSFDLMADLAADDTVTNEGALLDEWSSTSAV